MPVICQLNCSLTVSLLVVIHQLNRSSTVSLVTCDSLPVNLSSTVLCLLFPPSLNLSSTDHHPTSFQVGYWLLVTPAIQLWDRLPVIGASSTVLLVVPDLLLIRFYSLYSYSMDYLWSSLDHCSTDLLVACDPTQLLHLLLSTLHSLSVDIIVCVYINILI